MVTPWLLERDHDDRARIRLIAIPFAGAGASSLLPWAELLPPEIQFSIVRLPGRENRYGEPRLTDMAEVVGELAPVVAAVTEVPTVVFGYSLGALIGYELAARMHDLGRPPVLLVCGGSNAPHVPRALPLLSVADDETFIRGMRRLGGTPQQVFEHRELLELVLPILRADFALLENYVAPPRSPLMCPIAVYRAENDTELTDEGVAAWGELTNATTVFRSFRGGHFFFGDDPREIVATLVRDVRAATDGAR